MYNLYFYVPKNDAEAVKQALFAIGAGQMGDYDQVCWQTAGIGQFYPKAGSHPHIGSTDKLERVEELKVEMVCEDHLVEKTIEALKSAHPYEEPAYGFIKITT